MGTEIELKAHVDSSEKGRRALMGRLEAIAGPGAPFVMDDAYWFPGVGRSGIRVRREKTAGKETTLITWKLKEKRDGMEINDEKEFTVSSGALFEELFCSLGLRKKIIKHKEGWAWNINGVNAELTEVSGFSVDRTPDSSGDEIPVNDRIPDSSKDRIRNLCKDKISINLGWFLELEILDCDDENAARRRLLDVLSTAGIDTADIENRYYSELLRGA
jgi:adenylate cyclase class 2